MSRAAARAVGLVLGAAVFALCAPAALADSKKDALQQNASSAQSQYQAASSALSGLQQDQENTKTRIGALQTQKEQAQALLSQVYAEFEQAQLVLDAAQAAAAAAQDALAQKQAEYDARYQNARAQLAAMQELHDGGSIALLSSAKNLYELLSFSEVLSEMMTKNREVLAALQTQAAELDARRQQAESAAAAAQSAQDALSAQRQALDTTCQTLAGALQAADTALSEQQAAEQTQAAVTEEAKKAYEKAAAELDAYVRSQSDKYTVPNLHCSLDFACPLASYTRLSCYYGEPDYHGIPHHGLDFAAPAGTPIRAAADGVVSAATTGASYGNYVQISHGTADDGNRYDTLYAHMSAYSVSVGQTVQKGEVIGKVGSTGDSNGNHLHLELRVNGSRADPASAIPTG